MGTPSRGIDRKKSAGFTLIEVIVIVAILAILAGILAPMIFSQIDDAKLTRAEADCKSISSAILVFRKDLGAWPNRMGAGCPEATTLLRGEGELPVDLAAMSFLTTNVMNFTDVLTTDDEGCYTPALYRGPYLPNVMADPWGNSYVVAASNFVATSMDPVFVLSAGPNGRMETPIFSLSPLGDDIGIRIK
jgi:general secretion pathway protein G